MHRDPRARLPGRASPQALADDLVYERLDPGPASLVGHHRRGLFFLHLGDGRSVANHGYTRDEDEPTLWIPKLLNHTFH